jgi:UDP-N-acetylmuramyl tripeptide synthase
LRRGAGATVPGTVALRIDPELLRSLAAGRQVTLVSATNGKTTTTRMLTEALGAAGCPVLSNTGGSNLERGVVAALMTDRHAHRTVAALEVDELALPAVAHKTGADLFVLGNLSRDQLDRMTESHRIVSRWQQMFSDLAERARASGGPPLRVVANADDPLVAAAVTGPWSVGSSPAVQVTWAAVGQRWTADAASCPICSVPWDFEPGAYRCQACGFARPDPTWELSGWELRGPGGLRLPLQLKLPGRSNRANAVLAVAAAVLRDVPAEAALAAMSTLTDISGRYAVVDHGSGPVRLLLAKNPAGWQEMLAQQAEAGPVEKETSPQDPAGREGPARPIVLALNARTADGNDTSWIWDVPFEMLGRTRIVVSGERAEDLALRLRYADMPHRLVRDPLEAVELAREHPGQLVDLLATYTAFTAIRSRLGLAT